MTMSHRRYKYAPGRRSGIHTVTAACMLLCCVTAAAAGNGNDSADTASTSIDNVNSWGTWELGIEPAAGPQAENRQVVPVRPANVQFRPNDNATFRPSAQEVTTNMPMPVNPPAPIPSIPPGTAEGPTPPTGDPRNR